MAVKALCLPGQDTQGTVSQKYFSKFQSILEEFLYNIHGRNRKSQTYADETALPQTVHVSFYILKHLCQKIVQAGKSSSQELGTRSCKISQSLCHLSNPYYI